MKILSVLRMYISQAKAVGTCLSSSNCPCSYGATHCLLIFHKILDFASSPPQHGLFYERFITSPELILHRVLSLSNYTVLSFPSSHSVAAWVFFLVFSYNNVFQNTVRTVCSVKLKLHILLTIDEFCFPARRRTDYVKNLARSSLLTIW